MKTNLSRIVFTVLLVAICGGFAWQVLRSREPVYHGKPLRFWLQGYDYPPSEEVKRTEADEAVLAIGTNAIPMLVELLGAKDYDPVLQGVQLAQQQHFLEFQYVSASKRQMRAMTALKLLGPDARSATPALIRLLEGEDGESRGAAATCLGWIGPTAQAAVPTLVKNLNRALQKNPTTEKDTREMLGVAYALGEMGAAARPAIPQLTTLSTRTGQSNLLARICARAALIKIQGNPQSLVTDVIQDGSDPSTWKEKAGIIYLLGTNAEPAVPFLLATLRETNTPLQGYRVGALQALGRIHAHPELCLPEIAPFLKSTNIELSVNAIQAVRAFGTGSTRAWPVSELAGCAMLPEVHMRSEAVGALLQINPDLAVPELTKYLENADPHIRKRAVQTLGGYGAGAKPASAALTKLLTDEDSGVRNATTNALNQIDPEAVAKAGVK